MIYKFLGRPTTFLTYWPEKVDKMASAEDDAPVPSKDGPRYRSVETRREVALARYYGMGPEGEQDIEEIAEYLRVDPHTVEKYIWESPKSKEVRQLLAEREARTRMDIFVHLKKRLDNLREMERELMEAKDVVVTGYQIRDAIGEIDFENADGVSRQEGEDKRTTSVTLGYPIPDRFEEVTDISEDLKAVWREIRQTEEQIRSLMALDKPTETKTEHTGSVVVEQKLYNFEGGDELPDAEIIEVESETVDVSQVGIDE